MLLLEVEFGFVLPFDDDCLSVPMPITMPMRSAAATADKERGQAAEWLRAQLSDVGGRIRMARADDAPVISSGTCTFAPTPVSWS